MLFNGRALIFTFSMTQVRIAYSPYLRCLWVAVIACSFASVLFTIFVDCKCRYIICFAGSGGADDAQPVVLGRDRALRLEPEAQTDRGARAAARRQGHEPERSRPLRGERVADADGLLINSLHVLYAAALCSFNGGRGGGGWCRDQQIVATLFVTRPI